MRDDTTDEDALAFVLEHSITDGKLSRAGSKWRLQRTQLDRFVASAIETIVRRPVELADINADIAELLVRRWVADGIQRRKILRRLQWFADTNRVAVALGLSKAIDFTRIDTARHLDASRSRQLIPLPDMTPPEAADGDSKLSMTLLSFLDEVYKPRRLVGTSGNTYRLYRHTLTSFCKWLGRQAVLADLNTTTVSSYISDLLTETKLSRHTIQKDRTQLVVLWNFAARLGWLNEFPQIPAIPCPDRVPDSWSTEEINRLLMAIKARTENVGKIPASLYWLAIVSVVYDTAERIGAVLAIRWDDIDGDGWLTIRGENRKGKTRDIKRKLRPRTVELINQIRAYRQETVFPWPYNYSYFFTKFGKILQAAGLPNTRRNKLHKIRRTSASNFEAAGGNATDLLDHDSRKTTKKAYLDPKVIKTIQPADIMPGLGQKAEPSKANSNDAELLSKLREMLVN